MHGKTYLILHKVYFSQTNENLEVLTIFKFDKSISIKTQENSAEKTKVRNVKIIT